MFKNFIYCTCRPYILEYSFILQTTYLLRDINKIESIQHRIRFLNYDDMNKHDKMFSNLNMHTILCSRKCFDVNWIYKLSNNKIDCLEILNILSII